MLGLLDVAESTLEMKRLQCSLLFHFSRPLD